MFCRDFSNQLSWILSNSQSYRSDEDSAYPASWSWEADLRSSYSHRGSEAQTKSWHLEEKCYDSGWPFRSHPQGLPKEQRILALLNKFDFQRVHVTMVNLHWTWGNHYHSPTIDEMKDLVYRLADEVLDHEGDDWGVATGGFAVVKKDGILNLSFVAEEAEE